DRLSLGNLSGRAADLRAVVGGGAGDAVLGPRCVLWLAVPVRGAAGADQPGGAATGRAADRRPAGAARTVVGHQVFAVRRTGGTVVLFDGAGADPGRGRTVQDRHFHALPAGVAVRAVCAGAA